ncbi:monofunctional biosynthetic peptidoglycan transglycosylase [Echinicola pacifica]|nr:monofunctional biosynthetic peptidoglycan transglycosylase [Echinicola pacifica]
MKKLFRFIGRLLLWFFGITIGMTLVLRFVPVYFTPLMAIRLVEGPANEKSDRQFKKDWVPLEEISQHLVQAVVASEDQKFLDHNGFDMDAIKEAIEGNQSGKRLRGGSTITNQTAKNVFLWPGRNYLRKGLEAYFTVLIEFIWSKERIMEVYLNVIEMGDGIYGAEAAAQAFYKKPAAKLSRQEAAMIAAVLPNPLRWSPAKPTAYNQKRQAWILRNMNNLAPVKFDTAK